MDWPTIESIPVLGAISLLKFGIWTISQKSIHWCQHFLFIWLLSPFGSSVVPLHQYFYAYSQVQSIYHDLSLPALLLLLYNFSASVWPTCCIFHLKIIWIDLESYSIAPRLPLNLYLYSADATHLGKKIRKIVQNIMSVWFDVVKY